MKSPHLKYPITVPAEKDIRMYISNALKEILSRESKESELTEYLRQRIRQLTK